MRNAIIVSMLCSVLVGCGVEEGIGAHAVWITTPDAGDGCPIVCDPAGGFTADGCCEAASQPDPDSTVRISGAGCVATGTGYTHTVPNADLLSTGPTTMLCPLPLRTGDRLKLVSYTVSGSSTVTTTGIVRLVNAGASTVIGGPHTLSGLAPGQTRETIDTVDTTLSSASAVLFVHADGAGLSLNDIAVIYDHPL
jgi:hypothetical protein